MCTVIVSNLELILIVATLITIWKCTDPFGLNQEFSTEYSTLGQLNEGDWFYFVGNPKDLCVVDVLGTYIYLDNPNKVYSYNSWADDMPVIVEEVMCDE